MHYKETVIWRTAMDVVTEVYRLAPVLPREEVYGVRSQMTRAAVPCNIAEGWTRESPREKAHFLAIAQGSLAELETLITLSEEVDWLHTTQTLRVRTLADETSRMLTALRRRHRR